MINPREIHVYRQVNGVSPFDQWLINLKDSKGAQIIMTRIDRMALGNLGDHQTVGKGISELRIHFGPGYRA